MGAVASSLTASEEAEDFTLPTYIFNESDCSPPTSSLSTVSDTVPRVAEVNDLPDEMLLLIMSHFSVPDICQKIIPVCRKWQRLGRDKMLWKSLKFGSGWAATNVIAADTIKKLIKRAPLLRNFEYHSNNYVARVLQELAKNCPKLQTLELQSKSLTFRTVEMLVLNCPQIRQLSFYKIEGIDRTNYMPLANLKHLRALEFSGCDWADDEFMLAMAKNCTQLQYLNLQSLSYMTDKSLSVLLANCKDTLKTLMLCIWDITDESFDRITDCTLLERLTIIPATSINDTTFLKFVNLKNLHSLTLSRLWSVSSSACKTVFGHANLKNLKDVDLVLAAPVNDSVIKCLVMNASQLNVLSLERCINVTDVGLYAVIAWCSNLVYLNIEGMHGLHGHFLVGISSLMPQLRVLRVDNCCSVDPVILKSLVGSSRKKSKLSVFTEGSHVYNAMESSLMMYPATHQVRFQVDFRRLNFKKPLPFELPSYVFRRAIW